MEQLSPASMCNASGLTAPTVTILAAIRGATGTLCAVINAILLMSVFFRCDRSKPVHRLLMYITLACLLTLLVDIAQVSSIGCDFPWHRPVCEILGFFQQVTSWLFLLQVLWLVTVVCMHYWYCSYGSSLNPAKEALIWLVSVFASVILALIPIGTRGYGVNMAWCWLKSSRVVEQWVLWYGWLFVAITIIVAFLTVSIKRFEKEMEVYYHCSRGEDNSARKNAKAEASRIKKLCLCIAAYGVVTAVLVALCFVPSVTLTTPFLVITAITAPISKLTVPIILLLHLFNTVVKPTDHAHNNYKEIPHSSEDRERLIKSDDDNGGRRSSNSSSSSSNGSFGKKKKVMRSLSSGEKGDYFGEITGSLLTTDTERSELSSTI